MGAKPKKASAASENICIALYQAALLEMPHLVYMVDKNCSLIGCNRNLLAIIGQEAIENASVGALYRLMQQSGFWTAEQAQSFKKKDIEALLSETPTINQPEAPVIDTQKNIRRYTDMENITVKMHI